MMIQVLYKDDYRIKHLCIINTFADLDFLRDRFDVLEIEFLGKND
jgi:hypothetical protein